MHTYMICPILHRVNMPVSLPSRHTHKNARTSLTIYVPLQH